MLIKYKDYDLIVKDVKGKPRYFICFKDGQGTFQEVEVTESVFDEFQISIRQRWKQIRSDKRHIEHEVLSDSALQMKATQKQPTLEEAYLEIENSRVLLKAIIELPEKQKRRFILHCFYGFTYEEIAKRESVSFQSVGESVEEARKKIIKKF